jgi:hypothetical protein
MDLKPTVTHVRLVPHKGPQHLEREERIPDVDPIETPGPTDPDPISDVKSIE